MEKLTYSLEHPQRDTLFLSYQSSESDLVSFHCLSPIQDGCEVHSPKFSHHSIASDATCEEHLSEASQLRNSSKSAHLGISKPSEPTNDQLSTTFPSENVCLAIQSRANSNVHSSDYELTHVEADITGGYPLTHEPVYSSDETPVLLENSSWNLNGDHDHLANILTPESWMRFQVEQLRMLRDATEKSGTVADWVNREAGQERRMGKRGS